MTEKDPLDDLIVNEEEVVNKKVLKDILSNYAEISSIGKFLPKTNYHNLTEANKLVVYLLVNKVRVMKNIAGQKEEAVSSKKITEESGITQKHVSKYVDRLNGIVRREKNLYFIPNYNLSRLDFLMEIPTNKRKVGKTSKTSKKGAKTSPLKITKTSDIKLNKEQAENLKLSAGDYKFEGGPKTILFISNYIRENLKKEEFHEADVEYIYRLFVSMGIKVPHIKHIKQTMQNMCSKSQKMGWLEKDDEIFKCSVGGQIAYNEIKNKSE